MASAEPLRPVHAGHDPAPAIPDIRFSLSDQRDFLEMLATVFSNVRAVDSILRSTGFPRARIPSFENSSAEEVWYEILVDLDRGAVHNGISQLLAAVIRPYPANPVFRRLAATYLAASPASAEAEPTPADSAPPSASSSAAAPDHGEESATCHVIVRASTEEMREEAAGVLGQLGLDPREQWSTAHAVSYKVNSTQTDYVRAQLETTELGWTVVAPGLRDYLLHTLYVEGPDGRQFRITDAPAQQTVGNLAAEVVEQYGKDVPYAGRLTVVDKVAPAGHGYRLPLDATLDELAVADSSRIRVSVVASAGADAPKEELLRPSGSTYLGHAVDEIFEETGIQLGSGEPDLLLTEKHFAAPELTIVQLTVGQATSALELHAEYWTYYWKSVLKPGEFARQVLRRGDMPAATVTIIDAEGNIQEFSDKESLRILLDLVPCQATFARSTIRRSFSS
jgi:hypothetical protein